MSERFDVLIVLKDIVPIHVHVQWNVGRYQSLIPAEKGRESSDCLGLVNTVLHGGPLLCLHLGTDNPKATSTLQDRVPASRRPEIQNGASFCNQCSRSAWLAAGFEGSTRGFQGPAASFHMARTAVGIPFMFESNAEPPIPFCCSFFLLCYRLGDLNVHCVIHKAVLPLLRGMNGRRRVGNIMG